MRRGVVRKRQVRDISPNTDLTFREATEALIALTNPDVEITSMFSNWVARSRRTRIR